MPNACSTGLERALNRATPCAVLFVCRKSRNPSATHASYLRHFFDPPTASGGSASKKLIRLVPRTWTGCGVCSYKLCAGKGGAGMKELVEQIARALVDHPDDVKVETVDGPQATVVELRVHPEDLGKVIGRQGRTAKAMRTLLGASGMKLHKRFTLEILEE